MSYTIVQHKYMILTQKAIKAIDKPRVRLKLALALDFTEQWIIKLLDQNKENNPLTTYTALEIIRKETGLKDSQILVRENIEING